MSSYHTPIKPNDEILSFVKDNYIYEEDTGKVYKFRKWYNDYKETGLAISSNGHRTIKIKHKVYQLHNIIWFLYYNIWPIKMIDHKDRDRLNNKISNFRYATSSESARNKDRREKNKYHGVTFDQGYFRYHFIIESKRYSKRGFKTDILAAIARENHLNQLGDVFCARNQI